MRLLYGKPASRWGEALPLGNGHMGAMVYGGWVRSRIELTENTFYSGSSSETNNQPQAAKAFEKMRELAREGKYDRVHEEARRFIGRREDYGSSLPAGALTVVYPMEEQAGGYERGLDIREGFTWAERKDRHRSLREEVRISHPDRVMVITIRTHIPTDLEITFEPYGGEGGTRKEADGCSFFVNAYEKIHCDHRTGTHLEGLWRVKSDGRIRSGSSKTVILGGTQTDIFLSMGTDFLRDGISEQELFKEAADKVEKAIGQDISCIIHKHREDMKHLTGGTSLDIHGEDETSEKIPFLFQYGRYLLFCSSREDSRLPAHLQGIWNDNVACRIGWTCDMHLDINTQMNYWPAEITGLSRCSLPLFRWVKESLAVKGRQTAAVSYGKKGWVAELVSNAWGFAAPYWASPIAPCPTGGVWILTHLWEHYQYTQDLEFLRTEAYPLIKGAAEFFREYVFETEPGVYGCGPSISPENSFLYQNKAYQISNSCTYELLMIKELFGIYLETVELLEIPEDEQMTDIEKLWKGLSPYRVLENGCIAEWSHDLAEADPQHRHTSHLLGLYPFAQITPEQTPDWCAAAEKTIERKLTPEENWEDTGWARSMLMLYEARLHHGDKAYAHIRRMAERLLEPNQMVYHPPTRGAGAFDHVYELDGNTGLCSCICEMLMQSHGGILKLLPALPKAWMDGEVAGLHARGNITVSMQWKAGRLTRAVLSSPKPCRVRVDCQGHSFLAEIGDTPCVLTEEDFS